MENIKITECRVWNYRITKFWINITLQIKEEDITKQEKDILEELRKNWNSLVWVLQTFNLIKEDPNKNRKTKLQKLAWLMSTYCEKAWNKIFEEKTMLYTRNKVLSRTELSNEQLDYEIDLYINGLKEFN